MKDNVSRTARELLIYLRENPDAQDTLEGIMQWWLLERAIRSHLGIVQEALDRLVAEGYVVERSLPGAERAYKLDPEKLAEIDEKLAE